MAMTPRRRYRSRRETAPRSPLVEAERAAARALAGTLRELAAGLPAESRLAAEFAAVARSIDVAGVLGAWRLHELEPGHAGSSAATASAAPTMRSTSRAQTPA